MAVIPSRGVVHSRTVESVYRELGSSNALYEHDKPIPDAQNSLVRRALEQHAEWIWMVEEDIVVPEHGLHMMLEENAPVVAGRYKLSNGKWSHHIDERQQLSWAGAGCLLVHFSVFGQLGEPWFRTDVSWVYEGLRGMGRSYHASHEYGGHDVDFFGRLRELGVRRVLAPLVCDHLHVVEWGAPRKNSGCHKIEPFQ